MFEISAYLGTFNINEMNVYYTLFTLDENKRQDPMYIVNFKNKLDLQGKLDDIANQDDVWKDFFLTLLKSLSNDAYPIQVVNSNFYLQIVVLNNEYKNKKIEKGIIKGIVKDCSELSKIHVAFDLRESI